MTNIQTARSIIKKHFLQEIVSIERFPTGLCHFVYDAKFSDGQEVVLRISGSDDELKGGIFWNNELRKLDIPVPEILFYDTGSEIKYSIHNKDSVDIDQERVEYLKKCFNSLHDKT
ncbi:MAG: hypothetical protein PF638_04595 [Candidatus Delongbacteria bacterium]|jgi:hypothetical protein|nr:hypothetical protein [Candidatus Delongbacteria bacterium]